MASQGIQMPSSNEVVDIPYGLAIFRTLPYAFMIPELVFGAWVWILVAATRVWYYTTQGWVMYVSISSFFFSLLLLMVYVFGFHRNNAGTWRLVDVIYHGISAIFYLSAAVLQASATIYCDAFIPAGIPDLFRKCTAVYYHLNAASTIFAFLTTLMYVLHSFQSYVH
ncbi:MAL-like protein [Eleutherodactylus coqui]|uniref:MAL-like protein n=1 Tax=Eleutherodactylus coqui TaxID=57060 RepID=UPI003462E53F